MFHWIGRSRKTRQILNEKYGYTAKDHKRAQSELTKLSKYDRLLKESRMKKA